jgi:hypothetical protein
MIYIIYPSDPSTSFLQEVLNDLKLLDLQNLLTVINCLPTDNSYQQAKEAINSIPDGALVYFMGHGTYKGLYGGENARFPKKLLICLKEMKVFKNKQLILFSCHSGKLLKSSREKRMFYSSIGFGLLPSEMSEVSTDSYLNILDLNLKDINNIQSKLSKIFTMLMSTSLSTEHNIDFYYGRLKLIIDSQISEEVLVNKDSKIANVLFSIRSNLYCD